MNKKRVKLGIAFFLCILLIGVVSASYCCERTVAGAWCQSVDDSTLCNSDYSAVPTSCEATSYCKTGVCIDSTEGLCYENTPQSVCTEDYGGTWKDADIESLDQCQLGCCLIGSQAAYVTQIRCETLASASGKTAEYLTSVEDQESCLALANPEAEGACQYVENYQTKCQRTTKEECQALEEDSSLSDVEFHEGYLCSAPTLDNICGPRGGTTCNDGKVYYLDTCGNLANIYDYSELNDDSDYWTYIYEADESCSDGSGNKGSTTCGNCDYQSGSTCAADSDVGGANAEYGDYICRDLDCVDYENEAEGFSDGEYPQHGEKWCASSASVETITVASDGADGYTISGSTDYSTTNLPGSQYYTKTCYNGEVTVEACSDYRQEVCMESTTTDDDGSTIRYATCIKNVWEDCYSQTIEENCTASGLMCQWLDIPYYFSSSGMQPSNSTSSEGICVPSYSPGFDRTSEDTGENGVAFCALGSSYCIVTYELSAYKIKQLENITTLDSETKIRYCLDNCYCIEGYTDEIAQSIATAHPAGAINEYLDNKPASNPSSYDEWLGTLEGVCTAIGDCGNSVNLIGDEGAEGTGVTRIKASELADEESEEE